jgi:cell division protease FtsH
MAQALLQYETIDREQISAIMEGRTPGPPKDWQKPADSGRRRYHGRREAGRADRRTAAQH